MKDSMGRRSDRTKGYRNPLVRGRTKRGSRSPEIESIDPGNDDDIVEGRRTWSYRYVVLSIGTDVLTVGVLVTTSRFILVTRQ